MLFWVFMLVMDLLIPLTMIGYGRRFMVEPPHNINTTFGYRSNWSMKSKETWDFAHRYCGKVWYIGGLILLPFTWIVMLCWIGKEISMIGTVGGIVAFLELVPLIASVGLTEHALRKTFDRQGHKK